MNSFAVNSKEELLEKLDSLSSLNDVVESHIKTMESDIHHLQYPDRNIISTINSMIDKISDLRTLYRSEL